MRQSFVILSTQGTVSLFISGVMSGYLFRRVANGELGRALNPLDSYDWIISALWLGSALLIAANLRCVYLDARRNRMSGIYTLNGIRWERDEQ